MGLREHFGALPAVCVLGLAAAFLTPAGATATDGADESAPAESAVAENGSGQGMAADSAEGGVDAAEQPSTLPPHAFGLYAGEGPSGPVSGHHEAVPDLTKVTYPDAYGALPGATSSTWNRSLHRWCVYSDSEYGGVPGWVAPGMTAGVPQEEEAGPTSARPVTGERC